MPRLDDHRWPAIPADGNGAGNASGPSGARLPARLLVLLLVLLASVLGPATAARAQSSPATVLSCTVTMSDLAFGSFDVLSGAAVSTNGLLTVTCPNLTATVGNLYLCVAISARSMVGATYGQRLAFDIFSTVSSTASWSNTTPIVVPLASLNVNQSFSINVRAAVTAAQQGVRPDSYSQSLSASVTYGTTSCTSGLANVGTVGFQATATVLKSCNISAGNLSFGTVGDLGSIVDGQSALSVQCSSGTGYTVGLDGGLSGASDPAARTMTGPDGGITYGLYQNGARTMGWSTSQTVGGTGNAGVQVIPVYGRVPAQPTPAPGTYSDTIVATVTY